jgi:hypothetical protein
MTCVTNDIEPNYTARAVLGRPVAAGGFTPSQWKIGGAFSGTRRFGGGGEGTATCAIRSASSIAPLMLSIRGNCGFCGDFLLPSKAWLVPPVRPARVPVFSFHPFVPIAKVMLMFLLIALLSVAMIDTAVGVVARVGRR